MASANKFSGGGCCCGSSACTFGGCGLAAAPLTFSWPPLAATATVPYIGGTGGAATWRTGWISCPNAYWSGTYPFAQISFSCSAGLQILVATNSSGAGAANVVGGGTPAINCGPYGGTAVSCVPLLINNTSFSCNGFFYGSGTHSYPWSIAQ